MRNGASENLAPQPPDSGFSPARCPGMTKGRRPWPAIRPDLRFSPPLNGPIKYTEIDHLGKFAAALRRAMPGRADADLYWGLHFALAMSHYTIREKERLAKLSEGSCDLNDVAGIIDRVVSVSVTALS